MELAIQLGTRGQGAEARQLLEEALEILKAEPPGEELARAYVAIAFEYALSYGRGREAIDLAQRALALAAVSDPNLASRALEARGYARCRTGDFGGLDDLRKGLDATVEHGWGSARPHINLADWIWWTEGPAPGLQIMREGIDYARSPRPLIPGDVGASRDDVDALRARRVGLAPPARRRDPGLAPRAGRRSRGGSNASLQVKALVLRGRLADASQLAEEMLAEAHGIDDAQIIGPVLATAAALEHARDNRAAAAPSPPSAAPRKLHPRSPRHARSSPASKPGHSWPTPTPCWRRHRRSARDKPSHVATTALERPGGGREDGGRPRRLEGT